MNLEQNLVSALRDRADGDVDMEHLVAGAVSRGRTLRRRQLAGGIVAATVLAVAAVGAVVLVPEPTAHNAATPGAWPPYAGLPRPPLAEGAVRATDDPGVVASDPSLFHLDIDGDWWVPAAAVEWHSDGTAEKLRAQVTPRGDIVVTLAPDRATVAWAPAGLPEQPVRVDGQPGKLVRVDASAAMVIWQPLPGAWASFYARGLGNALVDKAGTVRFDHVFRCLSPVRLGVPLPGAELTACGTYFRNDGLVSGYVTVDSGQSDLRVTTGEPWKASELGNVNETVGNRQVLRQGGVVRFTGTQYSVVVEGPADGVVARQVAGALEVAEGYDPAGWFADPLA